MKNSFFSPIPVKGIGLVVGLANLESTKFATTTPDTRALAKYLADYVQKEFEDNFEIVGGNPTNDDWKAWTSAGLEAFESIENVKINIENV
jgi:ribosomal protein L10